MAYGNDVTVFVEDQAGDLGAVPSPVPWWFSPDVDIPAHSGEATQGVNQVRIRVHAHEEPIIEELIAAEVYVGQPSLVMSPSSGTVRIDPGNLRFRPANLAGSEPVATTAGGTLTFNWTPATSGIAGPGHRCLVLRAFPESVTPPTTPFDVPNEQHEAQRNIVILSTGGGPAPIGSGGAGTPKDPRRPDEEDGRWWEAVQTMAVGRRRGRRFVVWAFDPSPNERLIDAGVRRSLKAARVRGFSKEPPAEVQLDGQGVKPLDPGRLPRRFARRAGIGTDLFDEGRLLAAAAVELGPRKPSQLMLRFDHSNLDRRSAVVLHGAQWDESGRPEGGLTIVAVAPEP